jgi:hypothetical protein
MFGSTADLLHRIAMQLRSSNECLAAFAESKRLTDICLGTSRYGD